MMNGGEGEIEEKRDKDTGSQRVYKLDLGGKEGEAARGAKNPQIINNSETSCFYNSIEKKSDEDNFQ